MKLNYIIVLGYLIAFTVSDCISTTSPSSLKDCNGQLSEAEKQTYKYCCIHITDAYKQCVPYTKEAYDNYEKARKESSGLAGSIMDAALKVECDSSYLKLGLLSLLFFIF